MPSLVNRRQFLALSAASAACRRAPRTIRAAVLPKFNMAPIYLADERGFFRDEGLKIEIQAIEGSSQTIPLLASGALDVSFAAAIPALFNAVQKGASVRLAAAREVAVPHCNRELYGRRRSFPNGFDARSLKAKRVAVTAPTSLSAFLLDTVLASAGLATADVQLLPMRLRESAAALLAGQIDVLVEKDMDFLSPEIVPGPAAADLLPGFQYTYIHFGSGLIEKDPKIGAAFLRAYFRGAREFRDGKTPAAFDQLARSGGMDPNLVRTACRLRILTSGEIDPLSVRRMIEWSAAKKFIPAPVDPAQMIDTRFLGNGA